VEKRVCGLETEYALSFEARDSQLRNLDAGAIFGDIEAILPQTHLTLEADSFRRNPTGQHDAIAIKEGWFVESGARCYYDAGHVEWATPETTSAQQAVLYELAGDRTVLALARSVPMARRGRVMVIKNNVDYVHGHTYGCHENYQVVRRRSAREDRAFFRMLVQQLTPFLVTRQIFCGAGKIGCADPQAARTVGFQLSQRADFIERELSPETRAERAIINERDESLSGQRYRRLHLIIGDSNLSPYASILKLGTTRITLHLIEQSALQHVPRLVDPIAALKAVSYDPTCRVLLPTVDGQCLSPIALQRLYLDTAQQVLREPDQATYQVLSMWQDTLDQLERDPLLLRDRLDWVAKQYYLFNPLLKQEMTTWEEVAAWSYVIDQLRCEDTAQTGRPTSQQYARYQHILQRHGLDWSAYEAQRQLYFQLRERDLRYHDLDSEYGLFALLQARNLMLRLYANEEAIVTACNHPPGDTRAVARARVIRWAHETGRAAEVLLDWGRIQIGGGNPRIIQLDEPLELYEGMLDSVLRVLHGTDDQQDEIRLLGEVQCELPPRGLRALLRRFMSR